MTIAPTRKPSPRPRAADPISTELVPAAPPPPINHSPRPHYIAAGAAAAVELVDAIVWLWLRPMAASAAYLLIMIATLAAAVLVGAVGSLGARPVPARKAADR